MKKYTRSTPEGEEQTGVTLDQGEFHALQSMVGLVGNVSIGDLDTDLLTVGLEGNFPNVQGNPTRNFLDLIKADELQGERRDRMAYGVGTVVIFNSPARAKDVRDNFDAYKADSEELAKLKKKLAKLTA